MKTHTGVLVVFSCLHTAMFTVAPPEPGETLWCVRCQEWKPVITAPHDYAIRCDHCTWRRHPGNARMSAETLATSHSLRRPGHRVTVTDCGEVFRVFHVPILDFDAPPF